MRDINTTTISGNLTRQAETRQLPSGTLVVTLRVAVNGTRKQGDEYVDKPNYFDVEIIGAQGNLFATLLQRGIDLKGHRVIVNGELDYQEWQRDGQTRSKVVIKVVGAGQVVYEGEPRGRRQQTQPPQPQHAAAPQPFVPQPSVAPAAPLPGTATAPLTLPQMPAPAAQQPARHADIDDIPF